MRTPIMTNDFGWDFSESKATGVKYDDGLPPWGNRRNPMPIERLRYNFLSEVPLLSRINERVLWALAYDGIEEDFESAEIILNEGEDPRDNPKFYVIREGNAIVASSEVPEGAWEDEEGLLRDEDSRLIAMDPITGGCVIARLEVGAFFGESALLTSQQRSATVRAGAHGLKTVTFDAQSFHTLIAEHVLVFRMIRSQHAVKADGNLDVKKMGLFNDLGLRELGAVLHDAKQESFRTGDAIVTQGEPGERFYIILSGEVLVDKDGKPVARLSRGQYFGETALLLDCPRTATVRAVAPTEVWSITREAFNTVLKGYLLGHFHHGPTIRDRFGRNAA